MPVKNSKYARLAAPLLLLAAPLVLFGRALLSPGVVASNRWLDMAGQFGAWRGFGFAELRRGNLALWNPHLFCGAPFFGGFQSALLYPPNWLHLFLPLSAAINAGIILHVFLAGLFTLLWCRRRGLSEAGSCLAGFIFMLGGQYFPHIYAGHLPQIDAMVWTPVIFLALDGLLADGGLFWLLLGMGAVALQILAGFPQYAYYTGLCAALYAAAGAFGRRDKARIGLGFAAIFAGGAALAAVQLLTGLAAARESVRGNGVDYAFAASQSLPPENLLTLFLPHFFGGPSAYHGRGYYWEGCLFVGATGLALAFYAVWDAWSETRRLFALAAAAAVLALGSHTPLFRLLYAALPGFDLFRAPSRFAFMTCLALAVLAGTGYDSLAKARPRRSPLKIPPRYLRVLALLAVAEMLAFAWSDRDVMRLELTYPREWKALLDRHPGDYRVAYDMRSQPNVAMILGQQDLWGYDAIIPRRYAQFAAVTQGGAADAANQYLTFERLPPILAMLRARYAFRPGPRAKVVELPHPMPRLALLTDWTVIAGRDAVLSALLDARFDPRRRAILETAPEPAPAPFADPGAAAVVAESTDFLDIKADLRSPALLLVTDGYSEGWRAAPLEPGPQARYDVLPADYVLRAIPLAAGRHHLRLEYSPSAFRVGRWISAASLLGYAGLWIFWARRKSRSRSAARPARA